MNCQILLKIKLGYWKHGLFISIIIFEIKRTSKIPISTLFNTANGFIKKTFWK